MKFLDSLFETWLALYEFVASVFLFLSAVIVLKMQERFDTLKKYQEKHDQNSKDFGESDRAMCLDKSLNAALDSFDNLFCRRCMVCGL